MLLLPGRRCARDTRFDPGFERTRVYPGMHKALRFRAVPAGVERFAFRAENTVGLTSSDVSRLVSFGRSLGTTALEGQIANCDMFCADFELRLSEAREKKKKYAKVLPPLGALAGAVIVIAAV